MSRRTNCRTNRRTKVPPSCDIFCTVIDNYGDIGVSWRLARQLCVEYGIEVRLWVDKLAALKRIWPQVDAGLATQYIYIEGECIEGEHVEGEHVEGEHVDVPTAEVQAENDASADGAARVEVREWTAIWSPAAPAAVAIEAFGCQLPAEYIRAMAARVPPSLWINLEYLSAEGWVAGCHGLSSPQPVPPLIAQQAPHHPSAPSMQLQPELVSPASPEPVGYLSRYFFFPGFTGETGGLLRERDLLSRRQAFQADPIARAAFLAGHGLGELAATSDGASEDAARLFISLFAYEDMPLQALLAAWSTSSRSIVCLVPEGRLLDAIGRFFGSARPEVGAVLRRGALTVAVLPFLSQDEYDRLLWSCDINFVRGEDSFVRAQWAARPFVWHVYPQEEQAHLLKLRAFLDRYCAVLPSGVGTSLADFWLAWNGHGDIAGAWDALQPWLPALREAASAWSDHLAGQGNLAAALAQFCANHV